MGGNFPDSIQGRKSDLGSFSGSPEIGVTNPNQQIIQGWIHLNSDTYKAGKYAQLPLSTVVKTVI